MFLNFVMIYLGEIYTKNEKNVKISRNLVKFSSSQIDQDEV
jgi:hypothetical protein